MNLDFLGRLRQELRVTLTAAEETVLTVAERVNRKVQLLRLHWKASQLHEALARIHHELGQALAEAVVQPISADPIPTSESLVRTHPHLDPLVSRSREQSRTIKEQLNRISSRIVSMQSEAIREDLVRFTRELEFRGATLQYCVVTRGAAMAGRPLRDLTVQPGVHIVSVLRGPLVLPPDTDERIQPNDGILLLGAPDALVACTRNLAPSPVEVTPIEDDLIERPSHV